MLRRTTGALGAAALSISVASVGLAGAPAQAHPTYHPWGTVKAHNQKLKSGCHKYTYRYRITAPTEDWSAEIFLVNPHHHTLASAIADTASEPDAGKMKFTLCRASAIPGTYKLKMKVTYNVDRDVYDGYVKPSTFKLTDHSNRRF